MWSHIVILILTTGPGPGPVPVRLAPAVDHPRPAVPAQAQIAERVAGRHRTMPPSDPTRDLLTAPSRRCRWTLAEIEDYLEQIVERWRSQTAAEQRGDLVELDDLLGRLDDLSTDLVNTDTVDEVRGRIEILMDEIEIRLGVEPPLITGVLDSDLDSDTDSDIDIAGDIDFANDLVTAVEPDPRRP